MKNLLLLLLLLPFMSHAQFSFQTISGKWQEVTHTSTSKETEAFIDTLRVEIRPDGFMMVRHTIGATLTGQAEIKKSKITLESKQYTIVEASDTKLVLSDEEGLHTFSKKIEFTNAPVKRILPGVAEGEKNMNFSALKGEWTCYKKTDPEFTVVKFYIKRINFIEDKGSGTFKGNITFNNSDSVYTADVFMYIKDNHILISGEEETLKVDVMKSSGEELVLKDGQLFYFLKQFGKKELIH